MEIEREVVVVGSANMDLVFRADRFPAAGETIAGQSFSTFPGGKGANQAVAAGKLGGGVLFVGKVGEDAFGDELIQSLIDAGVDASGVLRTPEARTGVASINVDRTGQNQIIVVPGANGLLGPSEALEAAGGFRSCKVALFQHETPVETVNACILAASGRCLTILNPAPARAVSDEVLAALDYITPNETEARVLTGVDVVDEASCADAAWSLLDRGVKHVVVTLGSQGCFYMDADGHRLFPALKVQPVDTTAAGDAFNGALALFLARGKTVDEALTLANAVGALSTTKAGAQASMPTFAEVKSKLGG
jgi:ribokinase